MLISGWKWEISRKEREINKNNEVIKKKNPIQDCQRGSKETSNPENLFDHSVDNRSNSKELGTKHSGTRFFF